MPKIRRKGKSGRRKGRQTYNPRQISPNSTSFSGAWPKVSQALHCETLVLLYQTTLTSTAGGVIANVFGCAPTSSANWADTNAVWGEYRTLSFRIKFFPTNRYSKVTTTCRMLIGFADRRDNTAASSYANALRHESALTLSLEDPWTHRVSMNGTEEGNWIGVGAPTDFYWLKYYATGLTVSTEYGIVVVEYLVQFRNVE